jgi:hypothetical protein
MATSTAKLETNGVHTNGIISSSALLSELYAAPDSFECRQTATKLADYIRKHGMASMFEENIISDLVKKTKSKSGIERESALLGLGTLFTQLGSKEHGADPFFLPLWPDILDRLQEVGKVSSSKFLPTAQFDLLVAGTSRGRRSRVCFKSVIGFGPARDHHPSDKHPFRFYRVFQRKMEIKGWSVGGHLYFDGKGCSSSGGAFGRDHSEIDDSNV